MSNTQSMCNSFKLELMEGYHVFSATNVARSANTPDVFYAALYLASASLGASTTAYSATGEISAGTVNYTAGGIAVTNATGPALYGSTATWNPSANLVWTALTAPTAFDTVLIYNQAQANRAVSVHTFGSQTITAGNFTLTIPTSGAGTSLLNLA
jgi:hypothetical protein